MIFAAEFDLAMPLTDAEFVWLALAWLVVLSIVAVGLFLLTRRFKPPRRDADQ